MKGWIGRSALVAMGGVFLFAGGLKALDPAGFTEQVASHKILPASLSGAVAYTLIPFEIALGTALLVDYRRGLAVGAAVVLLTGFLGLMGWTWATGGDVSECGCFGRFVERTPAETVAEDLVFMAVALLGLLAPARPDARGSIRAGAVAATAAGVLIFLPLAPGLPLESTVLVRNLVTGLNPGVKLEDMKMSLPDGSLSRGRHLVALLGLEEESSGRAADALNALAGRPEGLAVSAIYADEEEVKDAFFWAHAPTYPMYQVVPGEMRRLYRRLPRFFLLEDGVVKAVWESLPETGDLAASAEGPPLEARR